MSFGSGPPNVGQWVRLWSKDIEQFGFESLVGKFQGVGQYGWEFKLDEDTTWYQMPESVDAWKPVDAMRAERLG